MGQTHEVVRQLPAGTRGAVCLDRTFLEGEGCLRVPLEGVAESERRLGFSRAELIPRRAVQIERSSE